MLKTIFGSLGIGAAVVTGAAVVPALFSAGYGVTATIGSIFVVIMWLIIRRVFGADEAVQFLDNHQGAKNKDRSYE